MKKLVLSIMTFSCLIFTINAQEISENTIGLRLGDSDGFGAEISYQRAFGENNRIEADLGWRDGINRNGFKLTGLYQWVWNLDGDFNWYVGAGGGLASYKTNYFLIEDNTDTFLFAAGDIGIEYSFEFPLLLSLDFRPEIGFGNDVHNNNDLDFDIALGVRYQF